MFLPRRRITSLTLASLICLTVWYFGFLSDFGSGNIASRPPGWRFKQKPSVERLTPETPDEDVDDPSSPEGTPSDERPPQQSTQASVDAVEPVFPAELPSSTPKLSAWQDDVPAEIVTDTSPAPTGDHATHMFGEVEFVEQHPVERYIKYPDGEPQAMPKIQFDIDDEKESARAIREERLAAVKESFEHSWKGYKEHAWLKDEVTPIEGGSKDSFGGWAATLVDSLDSLWIMGMKEEFEEAVDAAKGINFNTTESDTINVFETTIRYLGGFLGAYDISGEKYPVLLQKATEVADLLYCAFDTPNRMPVTRWKWKQALEGDEQIPGESTIVAEIGSLTLEFTRLSQLTGDLKYYDAVARIMESLKQAQGKTNVPGLWPTIMNAKQLTFVGTGFTLGGMGDSVYEYLPKQHMLLGGQNPDYKSMYDLVIKASLKHVFFKPMVPNGTDLLFSTSIEYDTASSTVATGSWAEHLGCYAGGMVGLGAKLFNQPEHMSTAKKLVDGCIWAYDQMPTGIMPEVFDLVPCERDSEDDCKWDEEKWHAAVLGKVKDLVAGEPRYADAAFTIAGKGLLPGFVHIQDARYILRPEAIESVFVMYRLTGDTKLLDAAWRMFQAIEKHTRTEYAHGGVQDVGAVGNKAFNQINSMESFWLAETLKYFYLIFAEPGLCSLDDFVLNTEAHPFKRPKTGT